MADTPWVIGEWTCSPSTEEALIIWCIGCRGYHNQQLLFPTCHSKRGGRNGLTLMAEQKHPAVYDAPDFDQIARQLDVELDDSPAGLGGRYLAARLDVIKATLRQVWNARGAADIDKLDDELSDKMMVSALADMLRALDR